MLDSLMMCIHVNMYTPYWRINKMFHDSLICCHMWVSIATEDGLSMCGFDCILCQDLFCCPLLILIISCFLPLSASFLPFIPGSVFFCPKCCAGAFSVNISVVKYVTNEALVDFAFCLISLSYSCTSVFPCFFFPV